MATTKITKGKSFSAAVRYDLENGLNKSDREKISLLPATKSEGLVLGFEEGKRARLLDTNLIEGGVDSLAEQFNEISRQHPGIKEPVHKVSISIKPGEHLETHQWLEVGKSYLEEMGYKDSPFLIAQHREKDHEHIHILTSKIDFNGDVISDSFDKNRARKWAQSIEEKYELSRTEEKASEKGLTRAEIEQSMKTGKIPARIFLQETVSETLEKYQEASAFVTALEKQNVSVMIRTKADKEIAGISFGYDDKYFKGSNLGSGFTWNKLQERGLNYELQRDYGKLEEASQRASRRQSQSSGIKRSEIKQSVGERESINSKSIAENINDGFGLSESDRFGGQQSGRREDQRTLDSRSQTQKTDGGELSAVQSISNSAAENEQLTSESSGEIARGNETELRWTRRIDQGDIQTAQRTEQTNQIFEDIAAEKADQNFTAQPIIELEFDGMDEYLRQLEDERLSKLFDQLSTVTIYPERADSSNNESTQTTSIQGTDTNIATGAGITALDANTMDDNRYFDLADNSILSRNLGNDQTYLLDGNGNAGSSDGTSFSDISRNSDCGSVLRDKLSFSGNTRDIEEIKENLSSNLWESIDDAKKTVEETIEIQDRLEIEKVEKQKIEEAKYEPEFEIERGMSM